MSDFWKGHLYDWAVIFAKNLSRKEEGNFYRGAGQFLSCFLAREETLIQREIETAPTGPRPQAVTA